MPRTTHEPPQLPSKNLQNLRLEAGMTRAELALAAGIASNTVRAAEYGRIPSLRVQHCLSRALSKRLSRELTHLNLWPLADNGVAA